MKITVEFENLDEFQQYIRMERSMTIGPNGITITENGITRPLENPLLVQPDPMAAAVDAAAKEVKAEQKASDPEQKEAKAEPEGPVLDENFRLNVRKALASLNKMKTGNPAKKLIEATGYKRLTEVPLELLPDLLEKAEEAMKDA